MPQELNAKPVPFVRAFDQSWNIGQHESVIARLHHPQIWLKRRKRIVGNLRLGGGETGDQGRFAGVRKPNQADVGQQLQFETKFQKFAGLAFFVLGGRLVSGGGEAGISATAAATLGHDEALARCREIEQLLASFGVIDNCADRHRKLRRRAIAAGAIAAFAVPAALGGDVRD